MFVGDIINAIIELVSSFQSSIADVLIPDCLVSIPVIYLLFVYEFLNNGYFVSRSQVLASFSNAHITCKELRKVTECGYCG